MQIMVNGKWEQKAEALSVAGLLRELSLDSRRVAVELNRGILPRAQYAGTVLNDQDQLEIVTLVGGG
ncbi:MAG TPA: sulfur carrier protein ThiS [Phycisphaerae bacterium]|nr:sulfur carrier protein ThiS [Phycisphaerae bacterium]